MHKIVPHLSFYGLLVALLIFAFTTNNHPLAFFFGSLVAFVLDPILLIGALVVGAAFKNLKILIGLVVAFGMLLSIFIAHNNAPLGAEFRVSTTFIRTIAILGLALIANAIRLVATGNNQE